jgi:hypothetical protein
LKDFFASFSKRSQNEIRIMEAFKSSMLLIGGKNSKLFSPSKK